MVSAGVADVFLDTILKRNSFVTRRVNKLSSTAATSVEHQIQLSSSSSSSSDDESEAAAAAAAAEQQYDDEINQIFSQTNLEILEAFKNNTDLVDQFAEFEYCHKAAV